MPGSFKAAGLDSLTFPKIKAKRPFRLAMALRSVAERST
jgi:hypothetical protein